MDFRVPQFKIPIPMAILVKAASTPNDLAYAKVCCMPLKDRFWLMESPTALDREIYTKFDLSRGFSSIILRSRE
ncbi:MAG: hypothetical protein CMQ15_02075 [Gammaproteobacteria bacterium]|jgi:hypothetical protein|nr:hypothetical protein [Gammaproteobacteria bacterium]